MSFLLIHVLILGVIHTVWNMKVPKHVKEGGLKKKQCFTFGEGVSGKKKKVNTVGVGRGNENSGVGSGRGKSIRKLSME